MSGQVKHYSNLTIPESKREDFLHDVSLISDQAGLFAIRHMRVYDQEFDLLCFPEDQEEDVCFDYSYFENLLHEKASNDVETGRIQSNYNGSGQFETAVQALYFLAELYSDSNYCFDNTVDMYPEDTLRWISYVLHRPVTSALRNNLWDYYEQYMKDNNAAKSSAMDIINSFMGDAADFDVINTIVYVNDAINDEYINECVKQKEPADKSSNDYWVRAMARFLWLAKRDSEKSESELLSRYMKLLYKVSEIRDEITAGKEVGPVKELFATVAPPITVKLISTIYGLDFWKVWEDNKYKIGTTSSIFYANEEIQNKEEDEAETFEVITTEEFFGVAPEDRLYWWKEDGDVIISDKTQRWFDQMAEQHKTHCETMADEFSAIDWHQRLVKLLGKHKDSIKMFEHLYCDFLNAFHRKAFRAWIEMLEVLAESDISECRRLIAVLANHALRKEVFGV